MSKRNWLIIVVAYCSIVVGAWTSSFLEVDFSITTLSARSGEDYKNYQTYSKRFPVDEDGLAIALGSKTELNSIADYTKLESLRLELLDLDGVKTALGITSVELPEKSIFGSKSKQLLAVDDERRFYKQLEKLKNYPDVTPKFLSIDRKATRIFLDVDWSKTNLSEIEKILEKYHCSEIHLIGKEVFSNQLKKTLGSEMMYLPLVAGIILLVLFFFWFRDLKSLIVAASILALNLSLLCLIFWLCDIKIGLLTSTTPLLILVLSFSDIIHLLHKFKRIDSGSIEERLRDTIIPLRLPLWLTTLTTATAFSLFFVSGILEIIEFAFTSCVGIILAYFTARYMLPIFILNFQIRPFRSSSSFNQFAKNLIRFVQYWKGTLVFSFILFVTILIVVIARFEVNNSYHQTFGADTQIGRALRFTDQNFEGVRTIEVILVSKNGLNGKITSIVDKVESELTKNYQCHSVFSVNTAIKRLNRFNHYGKTSMYVIPTTINDEFLSDLITNKKELGLTNAMTDDQKLYRIVGRLTDIGSASASIKNELLKSYLSKLEDSEHSLFISGFSYVKDQSTRRITLLILIGIASSLIIAMCIIGIVFRSFKIAVIAFFPNVLPVLFGLALMIFTGIELNPTTAMALSIILGLALDDTIYFLSTIKRSYHLKEQETLELSILENTFPAFVTSVILMIGFGVLMFSSVESSRNIGLLVATMLLIALISDLVILPALFRAFWTKKIRT